MSRLAQILSLCQCVPLCPDPAHGDALPDVVLGRTDRLLQGGLQLARAAFGIDDERVGHVAATSGVGLGPGLDLCLLLHEHLSCEPKYSFLNKRIP